MRANIQIGCAFVGVALSILGGANAFRVNRDPAGTTNELLIYGAIPGISGVAVCGIGCCVGLMRFIDWRGKAKVPVLNPDPAKPPVIVTPSIPATTMELHNDDIDIQCVLRGVAETDAEGLKRVGAVLDYYASRKGGGK